MEIRQHMRTCDMMAGIPAVPRRTLGRKASWSSSVAGQGSLDPELLGRDPFLMAFRGGGGSSPQHRL